MINLLILRSETEVRMTYYKDKKEDIRKEKDCNITPFIYLSPRLNIPKSFICHPQEYGGCCPLSKIWHKCFQLLAGIESTTCPLLSYWTQDTGLKIADIIGMFPSITEITLHHQTMMSSMARGCLMTGGTGVEQTFCAMVTEIQTIVAKGGRGRGKGIVNQDL